MSDEMELSDWKWEEPDLDEEKGEESPEVTRVLEMLMDMNKKGQLRFIAAMTLCNDGSIGHGWGGMENQQVFTILGGLEVLKQDWMSKHIEGLKRERDV